MIYGVVYCGINTRNDKRYIGQTIRGLNTRKREHIAQSYSGSDLAFHQAIRKYGEEQFEWMVLDEACSQEELDDKECYWIEHYNTYYDGGYNMALGGQFNLSDDPDEMSLMRGGREFLVFDLEGNYVGSKISQIAFADEIEVSVKTVNHVLRGVSGKDSAGGYLLFYKDNFTQELLNNKINKIKAREEYFYVFTKEGEYVGKWNNKVHCENETGVSRKHLQRQLNQQLRAKNPRTYVAFYLNDIPDHLKYQTKEVV